MEKHINEQSRHGQPSPPPPLGRIGFIKYYVKLVWLTYLMANQCVVMHSYIYVVFLGVHLIMRMSEVIFLSEQTTENPLPAKHGLQSEL